MFYLIFRFLLGHLFQVLKKVFKFYLLNNRLAEHLKDFLAQ